MAVKKGNIRRNCSLNRVAYTGTNYQVNNPTSKKLKVG